MVQEAIKLPIRKDIRRESQTRGMWPALENLQQDINHIFGEFRPRTWRFPFRNSIFDIEPLRKMETVWSSPAMDIVDKESAPLTIRVDHRQR